MSDQKLNLQNISSFNTSEDLDIGKIFRLLLMQSKLIILLVFLGTASGIGIYLSTEKVYKVSSLLQVFNNSANNFNSDAFMDLYMGSSNTSNLDDVEDLYKSRTNMLKVIDSNKLNFKSDNLGYDEIKNIKFLEDNIELGEKSTYLVTFKDNGYEISNKDLTEKKLLAYGMPASFQTLNLEISRPETLPTEIVKITYNHPEDIFLKERRKFQVVSSIPQRSFSSVRNKGLLEISYLAADPEHGVAVLNFANNLFIQESIDIESEQARKAIEFIDDRISRVERELELDKTNLLDFKDTNKTIDVDIEVQTILKTVSEIENKIYELDIEIAKASNLYTDTNPFFQDLLNQRDTLATQRSAVESEIKELPLAQQQYIDLFRNLETTRDVYTELVNRRLEFSIKEASTLGNIRIVDNAYFDRVVSPQFSIIFASFIFSIIFAVIFAIVRGLFFIPLSNPAELADSRINNPIIGVVPKVEESNEGAEESERFNQSMESFIVNLNTLSLPNNDCTTVLLTSPTPENGKSFISRSLAQKLSKVEDKVLIIDCDFKRGDQHKALGRSKITLKEFSKLDELSIEQFKHDDNLYFLPKITGLPNSFEFLYSDLFNEKIAFFKSYFDFVIIDTPPLLSVSDTGILMTYSDINIGVVRHGLTKINEIKQLISIADQIGSSFDGFLYNAYERPSSYYGYYGFYGNYAYQYYAKKYLYQAYDYNKDA